MEKNHLHRLSTFTLYKRTMKVSNSTKHLINEILHNGLGGDIVIKLSHNATIQILCLSKHELF